jgi:DNA-binding NarL/FixJ family response regulator
MHNDGTRVLIADRNRKARSALKLLLSNEPAITTVAEAEDGDEILGLASGQRFDLVLLDWQTLGGALGSLLGALRVLLPDVFVLALSTEQEASSFALEAGVDAFVCKADPPEQLLAVIRRNNTREDGGS